MTSYRGRFAPSPTGPLHFGSLLAALASYLDARAHRGVWLVRIEDLDPPREQPGASEAILHALAAHGLHSDEPVLFQSRRLPAYEQLVQQLGQAQLTYPCNCNRARLSALGGVYDGHCLHQPPADSDHCAIRLRLPNPGQPIRFCDAIQGPQQQLPERDFGDYIIKRKDGLHAYQLAVVADDIHQRISHVVRGSDLLEVSARQLCLFDILGQPAPSWAHIPVINNLSGQKLSKQNHARPLDLTRPSHNLWHGLRLLGQAPEPQLQSGSVDEILAWGCEHWQRQRVPAKMAITDPLFSH